MGSQPQPSYDYFATPEPPLTNEEIRVLRSLVRQVLVERVEAARAERL